MSTSEIFFMFVPVFWFSYEKIFIKNSPLSTIRWFVLFVGCMILSFFLTRQLSTMMGGQWIWSEVLFYGWFLFALFVILQILKKIVSTLLEKIIQWPSNKKIRNWIIKISYYVIMFVTMVPFFLAMTSIHRVKVGDSFNPQTMLDLKFEDIALKTKDGLTIKAWFVPTNSNKAVIIAHGLGANKSNFIGTVGMWHQLGFNVLIFDFRGHGGSDGHTVSFGYKERFDVMAALDYLVGEKKFLSQNIWGYGVSFGAAAMIIAEDETKMFRALIIDSSFASLDTMADTIVEGEKIVPPFCRKLVKELGLFFVKLDLGFDIREHSPGRIVGKLSGVPILFIHGKGDPLIPWQQTQRLYENTKEPKQVIFLDTEGHFGTPNDPNYIEIIQHFITKSEGLYAKKP